MLHISVPLSGRRKGTVGEPERVSLWSILNQLVTKEDNYRVSAAYSALIASHKRVVSIECVSALLLQSSSSLFWHVLNIDTSVNQIGHCSDTSTAVDKLFTNGMFSSRVLHVMFSHRLPALQPLLLSSMQSACSMDQLLVYLELLADCIILLNVVPQNDKAQVHNLSHVDLLNKLVSRWQLLTVYIACYLLVDNSDTVSQSASATSQNSLNPNKVKLVDMRDDIEESGSYQVVMDKLYHVTQFEYDSFFSQIAPPAASSSLANRSGSIPRSVSIKKEAGQSTSMSVTVNSNECDDQYVLCSESLSAVHATKTILTFAMKVLYV